MRELKLRYFIDLASNIGQKSREDAQALDQAQKIVQGAIAGTNTKLTNWNTVTNKAVKETSLLQDTLTGTSNKFNEAGRAATQMEQVQARVTNTTLALDRALTRVGSNTSTERQITYMRRLADGITQAETRATRLRKTLAEGADKLPEVIGGGVAAYQAGKRVTAPFVSAYSNLESATTDLQVAMLDKSGKVPKEFAQIAAEAKKLGEVLPGGTKDFMLAARALIEQGVPPSVIANGGLRGSSYFGALVGLDQYQAATTVAKVREAHGLKDDELVPAADLMQRGRYGFGITPTDYLEVAKYAAPTYNAMKLGGLDKMRELLAIQGLAAQVGLEASSFGTNYSQMLLRTAQIGSRLGKKSPEAKEVNAMLKEHGIQMDFFTKDGNWAGNRNMIAQLQKLMALSPEDQLKVSNRIFGVEAGRPALRLADAGLAGFDKALQTIDDQASLDSRIELKMTTFAAKLEALGGTVENVRAQIATQFGVGAKPLMDGAANLVSGPLQNFFEKNPTAGTAGLLGVGAGASYLAGRLGVGLFKKLVLGGGAVPGAIAGGAAEVGASGGAASAAAAASSASRMAALGKIAGRVLKFGGPLALAGAGVESIGVLADENADKPRELSRIGVTTGGALGGAAAGAALGSVVPVVGTAVGAILGGLLGSFGGGAAAGSLFDAIWAKKDPQARAAALAGTVGQSEISASFMSGLAVPQADFLSLTAPGASATGIRAGTTTELKLGEGILNIAVSVSDERVTATPYVTRPLSLVRINPGNTNPGSVK